jgi:exopolysaccharide biosynthesis polyprenyl glycosylphosphotransferase
VSAGGTALAPPIVREAPAVHPGHRRGWLVRRALLAADLTGLLIAYALSRVVLSPGGESVTSEVWKALIFVATLPFWVVIAKLLGLYDRDEERADNTTADDLAGVLQLVTMGAWLIVLARWVTGTTLNGLELGRIVIFWASGLVLVLVARTAARGYSRRSPTYVQNTLIVGASSVGQAIARKLLHHPEYGLRVLGFVDNAAPDMRLELGGLHVLGTVDDLPQLISEFEIARVVVHATQEDADGTPALIRELASFDTQIDVVPTFYEAFGPNTIVHMIEGVPLIGLPPTDLPRSSAVVKRVVDLAVSTAALIVFAPLLLAIALAVKLDSRGPALYRHERIGRNRKRIDVLKFRTMRLDACRGERYGGEAAELIFRELMRDSARAQEFEASYKLADDPRLTRIGRFLRRTSLDEVPQLINVWAGDLSLVGPRAVTADELVRYGTAVEKLLGVRPGLTGYWQVNGRSRLTYEERVRLDLLYIRGWSFRLDISILAKTVSTLLRRDYAV